MTVHKISASFARRRARKLKGTLEQIEHQRLPKRSKTTLAFEGETGCIGRWQPRYPKKGATE
ncbi:MAG TPA: hypothetical protein VFS12_03125, partial [Terriglobia bacterium]|nr:hypothetical protein [Terriglobia bacterium]